MMGSLCVCPPRMWGALANSTALCARTEPEPAYRETSASSSSCSNLRAYITNLYQGYFNQNLEQLNNKLLFVFSSKLSQNVADEERPDILQINLMAYFSTLEDKQSPGAVHYFFTILTSRPASLTDLGDPESSELTANWVLRVQMLLLCPFVLLCDEEWETDESLVRKWESHPWTAHIHVNLNLVSFAMSKVFYFRSTDPVIWEKNTTIRCLVQLLCGDL